MKEHEEEIIGLCRELIMAKSYSGCENNAAQVLESFFKSSGYDDTFVDEYGNVIGHIKGNMPGKTILFDGHIDEVPVTNISDWEYAPFGAEMHDGRIYGRGASDMKGAVAAMAYGAIDFAEDCNRDFAGDIFVAGVVHEECFEGVASRSVSELIKPDFVVIGEASNLNLKIGQRGRAEIKLETFGVPAHSANPEKGVNAVYKMSRLIEEIRKLPPTEHPVLGKGILELTDIKSDPYPGASVVPEHCTATYDRRLLVGETRESVLAPLQALIESMEKEDPELMAKVSYAVGEEKCYTGAAIQGERFFPGWLFEKDEAFITSILLELKIMGFSPEITQYNFCTNGSHYAGEAGIKTIGFGPSLESLAHTINEYIEIDQLIKAEWGYYGILKALMTAI
jgi:Acetylornithine deacetylase/Succinyl-diaminopimelate desuccinylase and related deacylases